MLASLNKREKRILFLCIVVIGGAVFYALVLEPLLRYWQKLGQELEERQVNVLRARRLLKEKGLLESKYKEFSSRLTWQSTDEKEKNNLLHQIETIANSAGVGVLDIKTRPTKELGQLKQLICWLSVEGRMQDLVKFLYSLQTSEHLMGIERLQIKGARDSKILGAEFIITRIGIPPEPAGGKKSSR